MRIVVQLSTVMVQDKLSQWFILKDVTPSSSISNCTTVLIHQQRVKVIKVQCGLGAKLS